MPGNDSQSEPTLCGIQDCFRNKSYAADGSWAVYSTEPNPIGSRHIPLHLHDEYGCVPETLCSSWVIIEQEQPGRKEYFYLTGRIRLRHWDASRERRKGSLECLGACVQVGRIPSYRGTNHDSVWTFDPRFDLVHVHKPREWDQARFEQEMRKLQVDTITSFAERCELDDAKVAKGCQDPRLTFRPDVKLGSIDLAGLKGSQEKRIIEARLPDAVAADNSMPDRGSLLTVGDKILGLVALVYDKEMLIRPMSTVIEDLRGRVEWLLASPEMRSSHPTPPGRYQEE